MARVAMDRAVKAVEQHKMRAPIDRWRAVREEIHRDVCTKGFNAEVGSQDYGSSVIDASMLLIPSVGFLPPEDRRVRGTIAAVERDCCVTGSCSDIRRATGAAAMGSPGTSAPSLRAILVGRRADTELPA